jgi:outer membrane protein OmpA-like peptidoglycan-associated protein
MACCVLWNCWCNSLGFKFSSGFALGMDVFSRVEFLLDTLFLEPSTVWTFGAASGVHGHFFAGFVSVFLKDAMRSLKQKTNFRVTILGSVLTSCLLACSTAPESSSPVNNVVAVRRPGLDTAIHASVIAPQGVVRRPTIENAQKAPMRRPGIPSALLMDSSSPPAVASTLVVTSSPQAIQRTVQIESKVEEEKWASEKRLLPFIPGSAVPGPMMQLALKDVADVAKKSQKVYVRGRADSAGNPKQNEELAARRAQAVVNELKRLGVPSNKIEASHCASCYHVQNDQSDAQRRKNRSLELELVASASQFAQLPKPRFVF